MCGLIFSTTFVWNISHSKNWMRYDQNGLHVKFPLFLSVFNETSIFSGHVFKKKLWKSVQGEPSCSMQTGRRTDMMKLVVAFRNFAKAPKNKTTWSMLTISSIVPQISGVPRGGVWGVQTPPRNSEDIGGVLDRMSKKSRHLDFLLQFTVFSYGCNWLNKGFF